MTSYDRSVRAALADMPQDRWATWRSRYVTEEGLELQAQAVVQKTESTMRTAGEEATIRAVWVRLSDQAAREGTPEMRAAAGLAGIALGL